MTRWLFLLTFCAIAWLVPAPRAQALGCILFGCDCAVSASDIVFDAVNPLHAGAQEADGEVEVTCTGLLSVGAGVTVQLDDGIWGNYAARRMRSAAGDFLDYNIYKPDQPNTVWGDGTGASQAVQITGGLINLGGWSALRAVRAHMTPPAAAKPGAYSDTIVVRVIW